MRPYKLESGIPIPPITHRRKGISDLFRTMKKGQSVRLPKEKNRNAVKAAHRIFGKGKYTLRSNGSHFRIWRTG